MTTPAAPPPWEGQPYSVKRHGVTITNCDAEPVHAPGCVQAHGALLVLRACDLVIRQASENAAGLLGAAPEALLDRPVDAALGDWGAARLRECLARGLVERAPRHACTLPARGGCPALDVSVHTLDGLALVECEPVVGTIDGEEPDPVRLVPRAIARLQAIDAIPAFCDAACEELRALTGLDRVMVYRFHEDHHGEVIADARREDLPSWHGLHYPADDIPRPAREVFRRLWVRPVPDVDGGLAELVPLADPDTGRATDLTHCALRGPSVMYTEYLRNMGVAASLTMPIRRDGELWGLLAGHHYAGPRHAPHGMRAACEFLARVVSLQLRALEERERLAYGHRLDAVHQALVARAAGDEGLSALATGAPGLLDGLEAGGAAVRHGGRWHTVGEVPADAELDALAAWLAVRPELEDATRPLYATDALPEAFPPAAAYAGVASGVLAVPLSRARPDLLLWFRPETIRTIAWGGNPHDKPRVPGPQGPRLTPRASFEVFRESVRGRARPWRHVELDAAARLRLLLAEVVLGRAERLAALDADLARSEARYRLLADALPHLTWSARPDGTFEYANRMLGEYTGLTLEALNRVGPLQLVHPDDVAGFVEATAGPLARGEPHEAEYRLRRPDGTWRWVLSRAVPARDASGAVERWVGTTVDIDARRRAEDALREADRRKDDFLATLAHELRNPLAPIRNGLEILRLTGAPDPRAADAQAMMERQLAHLVRLVDDLLDVSRITRGKVELRRERIRVRDVVAHAVETSRPLVDAGRQLLAVSHAGEPLWVDGDLTRLAQVVSNLLNNAARFTPTGRRIDVLARHEGDRAVIEVRDEGAGIPAETLPRVFELFAQGGHAADRAGGGLGIGLSLARALCELHGGTIDAASPGPGLGSTFTVRLPLAPAPVPADGAATPAARGRARRVLVVDDNVDAADSLALLLRLGGHEVATAQDGPAALAAARRQPPEVVFLDIGLPGMDGYEVARRLRADPATAGTRLVALTGWGADEDRRRSHEAGFDLHLTKPVEADALARVLAAP